LFQFKTVGLLQNDALMQVFFKVF